jgi:fimbrial chaperone protein
MHEFQVSGRLIRCVLSCVCSCAALLASGAASAQVQINPVLVELGARQRAVTLTVSLGSGARAPMRLQTELLRWQQDAQGLAVTEPSDDLLVTPPLADIAPGTSQVFRIALRGARQSPGELAYRLVLEDIAEATETVDLAPGMAIKIRMRYDVPVLVAPDGKAVDALQWKPCALDAAPALSAKTGASCVRLLNAGNRRIKLQTLTFEGEGWQQSLAFKSGENLLAGAQREWRLPVLPSHDGKLTGVQAQTARGVTLRAETGEF